MESSHARISSGTSGRIELSRHARGLTASRGSTSAGSSTLRDRPYCLGYSAKSSPVAGEVSVTVSHRIAANTLERAESGPARYRFESMSTSPYLSAVRLSQRTGSNAVDGNGINAALSSSNTSATGTSSNLGQYESLASPSHRSSRRRLNCPYDSARMGGTMRLRRKNPTAFSTLPFSLPEYGLQNRTSSR